MCPGGGGRYEDPPPIETARAEALRGVPPAAPVVPFMEDRFDSRGMWKSPPQAMALYGGEIAKFLKDCMERLAALQRMAFALREIEEMDTEEICNILDVSRTNLRVLLYRGRNGLRECLEAQGVKGK